MKLFALFAVLPAVLALPKAYNPFFPPSLDLGPSSSHSNNPISHGDLNSRALIAAKAPRHEARAPGASGHMAARSVKGLRKVKRQSPNCVPRDTTTVGQPSATTTPGGSSTTVTTTGAATTSPSPSPSATTTTRSTSPATPSPTQSAFTVDPDGNGPFKGQATYYDTDVGYGSCGVWHKNWEPTVALSRELMDNWPGYNGLNPNNNPICGQRLQINYGGKSLIAEVQDTCPSCTKRWIDVSQGIFEYFAPTSVGMLGVDGYTPGMTWQWVDRNTPLTVLPH